MEMSTSNQGPGLHKWLDFNWSRCPFFLPPVILRPYTGMRGDERIADGSLVFAALMDFERFNPSNWACSVLISWSCGVDFPCPLLVIRRKT